MITDQKTPTDLRYELAQKEGVPPYMWVPPETLPLVLTNNERLRIAEGEPYSTQQEWETAMAAFSSHCEAPRHFETGPNQDHGNPGQGRLTKTPHPFSDFSHKHPETASASERDLDRERFQRLELAYDWVMCRTYKLLSNLNSAATEVDKDKQKRDYEVARTNYLDFIRNLDNHEPQEKKGEVNPAKCLGYGKVVRWVYIDPIIQEIQGKNVITGVTIVLEWNPHSSSSGIPVQHP